MSLELAVSCFYSLLTSPIDGYQLSKHGKKYAKKVVRFERERKIADSLGS